MERAHADRLRQLAPHVEMRSEDRDTIYAFLWEGQGYVFQSQPIIEVLKKMRADQIRRLEDFDELAGVWPEAEAMHSFRREKKGPPTRPAPSLSPPTHFAVQARRHFGSRVAHFSRPADVASTHS